jgi:GGDEF domain-containing protein
MSDFQILRYLKKWWILIMLITALGCMGIYYYCSGKQSYSATVVIEYTSSQASEGLNPDGSAIDTSEIISAGIISNVIDSLGLSTNVESIRSKFTITPVIPDEEEDRQAAAIKSGDEYTYHPTKYIIKLTVNKNYSADYARDVLDALISEYFDYYREKYVDDLIFPDNAANISTSQYEYIDCVDMLQNNANQIVSYLTTKANSNYSFYSAVTGYSFDDLAKNYEFIRDNRLAELRAYILENRLALNRELLLKKKENQKAQYEIQIESLDKHIEEAKEIIDQFGKKTLEGQKIYQDDSAGSLLVTEVEDDRRLLSGNPETTYDKLINQYADLKKSKVETENALGKCQEIIDIYTEGANTDKNSSEAEWASGQIDELTTLFNELYQIALPTVDECNQANGTKNLAVRTNVYATKSINLKLYLMLAIILFLIVGCGFAIVIGRLGDFIDYYVYADKKTRLPNRQRCDMEIERHAGNLLNENLSFITFKLILSYPNDPSFTREKGDELLRSFGEIIKDNLKDMGFAGYNGDGVFLVLAENCSFERAESYVESVKAMIESLYGDRDGVIEYRSGFANSSSDGIYEIRSLMRTAFARQTTHFSGKKANAEGEA